MKTLRILKGLLLFIAVFHLVFGFGLMFSVTFQKAAISLYGARLDWQITDIYFIRIIGSFASVLGYLAWMAARDPLRHKIVVIGFIEFFVLRNISRHLFADELYVALQVSQAINALTSVFFGVQAILLAYLLWAAIKEEESLPSS